MIYDWFYIFNQDEFDATALISKTYVVTLDGLGQKSVLVTKGNLTGVTVDGVYLPINLNSKNPSAIDTYAVHIDDENNVRIGFNGRDDDE